MPAEKVALPHQPEHLLVVHLPPLVPELMGDTAVTVAGKLKYDEILKTDSSWASFHVCLCHICCLSFTGKAAALHVLGKDDEAFSCYKTAVSLNHDYLDEDIMRDKYLWSDKAVGAVKVFISELKD